MEFCIIAGFPEEAFQYAQSCKRMDLYASLIEDNASREQRKVQKSVCIR
jgi:hypothetical protein